VISSKIRIVLFTVGSLCVILFLCTAYLLISSNRTTIKSEKSKDNVPKNISTEITNDASEWKLRSFLRIPMLCYKTELRLLTLKKD